MHNGVTIVTFVVTLSLCDARHTWRLSIYTRKGERERERWAACARVDSSNRMCSIGYDIELILSINALVTQEALVNPGLLNWVTTNMDTGQLTTNCLCVRTVPTVDVVSPGHLGVQPTPVCPLVTSVKVMTPCRENNNGRCSRVLCSVLWNQFERL